MGVTGDILLTVVATALVIGLPLAGAFGTLTAVWLLVPPNLIVPHAPHILLVHTVVLYGFTFRLMARRGPGEPSAAAYTPTVVHVALLVLVLVLFFGGVIFTPPGNSLSGDLHFWLNDFNLLVLFIVVLAVIRTISLRRAVGIIAVVLCIDVGIGLWERVSGRGWSAFFFEHLPTSYLAPGAEALQVRGGHVRSQAAAQFALEYGWVLAMLFPLLVVSVFHWSRGRRWWSPVANLVPLLAALAVVFSGSRSALVAAVAVLVLVVAIGGNRGMLAWGTVAILTGAITAIADPSMVISIFSAGKADPASVRLERLGPLFDLVVHHPFTGLGLSGISSQFVVNGVDDGYAVIYATLGVVGILAWLSVMAMSGLAAGQALVARRGSYERLVGAACLAGIVAAAVAAATYDFIDTAQSTWTLIVLGALGVAAAEAAGRRVVLHWSMPRLLLPAVGSLLGSTLLVVAPVSYSVSLAVIPDAPWVLTSESAYYPIQGTEMVNTLCPVVTNRDYVVPGTKVRCLQYNQVFLYNFPALAVVQVRGPTQQSVAREANAAFARISPQMPLAVWPRGRITSGKPAWAKTAPLWGGCLGAFLMLVMPMSSARARRSSRVYEVAVDETQAARPEHALQGPG